MGQGDPGGQDQADGRLIRAKSLRRACKQPGEGDRNDESGHGAAARSEPFLYWADQVPPLRKANGPPLSAG
jgi:hypothetical protein